MSSPILPEDPRTGRDRRVVTRRRTFKDGTVDPVIEHRRPLLTWGNAILLVIMVGFALYATGNLPQLDAFFDHLNNIGRSHNNAAVSTLIAVGPYLFGALVLAVFGLFVFLFINSSRRQHSDPKGWEKTVDLPPNRRSRISRRIADLPSMIMPIGKDRRSPGGRVPTPATTPAVAKTAAPAAATTAPDPIKAAAIAAAARAEAALETTPADLPSFVRPAGKTFNPTPAISPEPPPAEPQTNAATIAKLEAALATAKAAAAKAEATIAAAKAEAAIAAAKSEAAAAEAALAAAKADATSSGS